MMSKRANANRQASESPLPLTVYYDGDCIVCAKEVSHYARLDGGKKLKTVDIATAGFEPVNGRTREELMRQMHVRDAAGLWHTGVSAFCAIWRALPGRAYPLMARLFSMPVISSVARAGYRLFAHYRHLLPKHNRECRDGRCTVRNNPN